MVADSARNDAHGRLLDDIAAAMRAGNSAKAAEFADIAFARGIEHPLPFQARALQLDRLGNGLEALANYQKARELAPHDPMAANGVAICLGRLGRLDEAVVAFDAAIALDPNLATTHFHLGWICETHRHFPRAREAYERAVRLEPRYAEAWAGLATVEEKQQNWKDAKPAALHALALNAHQPRLVACVATAEIEEGDFASAETRLRAALRIPGFASGNLRTVMLGLIGDALDGQNRPAEAFTFYAAENEERRSAYAASRQALDMGVLTRDLAAYFRRTYPERWILPQDDTGGCREAKEHVFVMGFPRSGTTLLEQVLAVHRDVCSLEESDVLDAAAETFLRGPDGFDRLSSLDGTELQQARDSYWARASKHGVDARAKIFVDKLPLNTIKLPLIAKLFPAARVIFAVRDPRDVVLSCFRRHFRINASTAAFLSLEGAAKFYDSVMDLGEICREKLPLKFHVYRHEDLVDDFEKEVRRLCAFVGIAWSDDFRDFHTAARRRDIRSISASQVRRGLYNAGAGQWRRYAGQLEPVMPVLRRWIERFGYEQA